MDPVEIYSAVKASVSDEKQLCIGIKKDFLLKVKQLCICDGGWVGGLSVVPVMVRVEMGFICDRKPC